jgi:hypothetical protein
MHEGKEFELKTKYAKIKSCMEIKCEIDTDYLSARAHGFSCIFFFRQPFLILIDSWSMN